MQDLLGKIHSKAFWRVIIRPTEFNPGRIESLGRCDHIVRSSQVVLRGWDYPYIERVQVGGQDWIESSCYSDIVSHYEYWRFYQSAQFVHHFACVEEFHPLPWSPAPSRYLEVLNTLYTATEIFEFGARIADHAAEAGVMELLIELHGMDGRELTFSEMLRAMSLRALGPLVSHTGKIAYDVKLPVTTLLGSPAEAALAAAIAIFERFGWLNPSRSLLAEDQRKFLERRLGV